MNGKCIRRVFRHVAGFTLIEVMITVAILAILAAIAVPSYSDYLTRGRIPDATSALAGKQVRLEQYFQDNRSYEDAPDCDADSSSSRYFDFSCSDVTATTYTLTATGKGAMNGFVYTVNAQGRKATTGVPTGWAQPDPNNCWVSGKGGVC